MAKKTIIGSKEGRALYRWADENKIHSDVAKAILAIANLSFGEHKLTDGELVQILTPLLDMARLQGFDPEVTYG